jgi:hypothetical protein
MAKSTAATADDDTPGLVRLHHDDASACSWEGTEYQVDANGDVVVPQTAVAALRSHGFVPVPLPAAAEA